MKLVARLVVYATALVIVITARLPAQAASLPALRTASPESAVDPVRLLIAAVLLTGIVFEVLRRRTIWH